MKITKEQLLDAVNQLRCCMDEHGGTSESSKYYETEVKTKTLTAYTDTIVDTITLAPGTYVIEGRFNHPGNNLRFTHRLSTPKGSLASCSGYDNAGHVSGTVTAVYKCTEETVVSYIIYVNASVELNNINIKAVSVANSLAPLPEVYSSGEICIGIRNGKPLYRKVFDISLAGSSGTKAFTFDTEHDIDYYDEIYVANGSYLAPNNPENTVKSFPANYYHGNEMYIRTNIQYNSDSNWFLYFKTTISTVLGKFDSAYLHVVLEYTKSNDTPISPSSMELVPASRTIAGIDLVDDIGVDELKAALSVQPEVPLKVLYVENTASSAKKLRFTYSSTATKYISFFAMIFGRGNQVLPQAGILVSQINGNNAVIYGFNALAGSLSASNGTNYVEISGLTEFSEYVVLLKEIRSEIDIKFI